jgi:hypothetical protein
MIGYQFLHKNGPIDNSILFLVHKAIGTIQIVHDLSILMQLVEEILEARIIWPSQSSYFASVVMVHKKEVSWNMCPYYREINKITIKDKFPISIINELLDELHGVVYFTKLDICSGYHHITMKEEDIPRKILSQ